MSISENDNDDGSEDESSVNSVIHERTLSDVFKDIETANSSAIDFSKVDISKIPLELLTSNVGYLQNLSTSNLLPEGLERLLLTHKEGDEKSPDTVESVKLESPKRAILKASDSIKRSEEDIELAKKLRETFKSINCREDGRIIVDLVSFKTGLRMLGLGKIEKKEIGKVFADFCEDGSTEVEIENIVADIVFEKTKRIQRLKYRLTENLGTNNPVKDLQNQLEELRGRMVQKSLRCLELENEKARRDAKEQQLLRDLDTKNRLLEKQVSSLRENLADAQTQYKSDLMLKVEELNSLQASLNESLDMQGILKEQLTQYIRGEKNNIPLAIRHLEDELNILRTKSIEAEQQYRGSIEEINTRANKYRTKYENLKEQTTQTLEQLERERSELVAEVQTLRFQLRIMEENNKDFKRPMAVRRSRISPGKSSLEDSKRRGDRSPQGKRQIGVMEPGADISNLFSKRQKTAIGSSGMKECTTLWRFLCTDMSKHSIRLIHVQASREMDSQAKCRRVIMVDNEEHYNKRSNSKNYLFEIRTDEVRVTIAWENSTWCYKLMINGHSFETAQRRFKVSEK